MAEVVQCVSDVGNDLSRSKSPSAGVPCQICRNFIDFRSTVKASNQLLGFWIPTRGANSAAAEECSFFGAHLHFRRDLRRSSQLCK